HGHRGTTPASLSTKYSHSRRQATDMIPESRSSLWPYRRYRTNHTTPLNTVRLPTTAYTSQAIAPPSATCRQAIMRRPAAPVNETAPGGADALPGATSGLTAPRPARAGAHQLRLGPHPDAHRHDVLARLGLGVAERHGDLGTPGRLRVQHQLQRGLGLDGVV